jgi:hypothetical protein
MGIHDVQRHLYRIEVKVVSFGGLQHVKMNVRMLVAGEANEADLASLLRFKHRLERAAFAENALVVSRANDLVELHQIDMIGLQAFERFVDLTSSTRFECASIFDIKNAQER